MCVCIYIERETETERQRDRERERESIYIYVCTQRFFPNKETLCEGRIFEYLCSEKFSFITQNKIIRESPFIYYNILINIFMLTF